MKKIKKKLPVAVIDDDPIIPEAHDRSSSVYNSGDNFSFEGEYKPNPVASKFFTLFDDETALETAPIIRVKHTRSSGSDKWRIFLDTKLISTVEGSKLLKKEREFLHTVDGFKLLIEKGKQGGVSIATLKKEIREVVETRRK